MNIQQIELIQRQLIEFLNSQTGISGECDVSMNLIEQGVLDSLLVTDLVLFVQNRFGIELTPRDISPGNLSSIERMAQLIRHKQEKQGQAA
ncbi:MAG: acyl carrier protein [Planctomycetota bacterium]